MSEHPVKALRLAVSATQVDFGRVAGVTAGRISQVENRVVDPKTQEPARLGPETVLRLAEHYRDKMRELGITVEDLLRGTVYDSEGAAA